MFDLVSKYKPSGDQPQAIDELVKGIEKKEKYQVLLGATGTGKTFTVANVIAKVNKPTLVLAHNKTLAGQLYAELKELFPNIDCLDGIPSICPPTFEGKKLEEFGCIEKTCSQCRKEYWEGEYVQK